MATEKVAVEKLVVDGVTYIPEGQQVSGDIKIVILQRGWIMVGRFERQGNDCKLHDASVIRSWGTTRGLGEIAKNGPTDKTILDKTYGIVEFDYLTVVAMVSCEVKKWQSKL